MNAGSSLPQVEVRSRAQLRAWLETHHAESGSIWLVTWKKASLDRYVSTTRSSRSALLGWVDSLPRKLDAERSMLLLSPRKPGSAWSAANKRRVERLISADLMHAAGLAIVEAAKADRSWNFLDDVEKLETPEDLAAASERFSEAARHFNGFPKSVKRGILEWIKQAKRPETRAKRIDETARMASEGKRANQFR